MRPMKSQLLWLVEDFAHNEDLRASQHAGPSAYDGVEGGSSQMSRPYILFQETH